MGIVERFRGGMAYGSVDHNELNKIDAVPFAIAVSAVSSQLEDSQGVFNAIAVLRQPSANDSAAVVVRGMVNWWLEDTAGVLFADTTMSASAGAAGVTFFPTSTALANGYNQGRVLSSTAGNINIAFTTTTGNASTCRMFYALPTGLIVAGSTLVFAT